MTDVIDLLYSRFRQNPVISIDSRKVAPGCLFFGLQGERVDGSVFGTLAVESGAHFAVVRRGACLERPGVIFVDDPLLVLQKLASHHRNQFEIPILGITGSNGKTTTKALVNLVLSSEHSVCVTQGNLNNHIGVPLTLLSLKSTDQIAIVEMGANHIGEIQSLCTIVRPTHGLVTNIGKAHLEGFGGIEGVKVAKAELYESLEQSGGLALINQDELYLSELSTNVARRVFYGIDISAGFSENAYRFSVESLMSGYAVTFRDANDSKWSVNSSLFGAFNLANIATAIAVGLHFEISGQHICDAITGYTPDNNRSQRLEIGSNTFILDAYNANPTSTSAAIQSFAEVPHSHKVMILGAMLELGEYALAEHLEVARLASEISDTTTICIGEEFKSAASRFRLQWYPDVSALVRKFSQTLPRDTLFLVKGSRAMRLELLLTAFH
jgi:UDP-N-acetylmuramoyl-tripeptide--D-alanyl-D-alanine ligase